MPQPRKFDHDEARRRYAAGEGGPTLARAFGVSAMAVYRVVNPKVNAQMAVQSAALARRKREPCRGGCGRLVWRHGTRHRNGTGLCPTCHGLQRAKTVRDTTLLCSECNEWKPDEDFPRSSRLNARRHRGHQCRPCQTITRRARRHANPEASAAYDREYQRRRRASQKQAV